MTISKFLQSGHKGTLISAFIYSDMSFMVWVMMGPLVIYIAEDLNLTEAQQYTLVTIPMLAGVLFQIPVGILVDHFAPKRIGLIAQVIVILTLLLAFISNMSSISGTYIVAMALGLAGTSMAVALPLCSRWYPDEYQGLVMGIAGAASSGTVFTAALAPMLAEAFGWRAVFGFATLPLIATAIFFQLKAKDNNYQPEIKPLSDYLQVLKEIDAWWFILFYSLSFGGVIALSSVMVLYFHQQYQFEPVTAGYYTAACILAGTALRPVGGWMADKFGGIRSMQRFYGATAVCMLLVSFSLPSWLAIILLITGTAALGMGSGLEHSVANMAVFSIALLGDHPESVSLFGMFYNLFFVTLGNLVSGSLFMAIGYWAASPGAYAKSSEPAKKILAVLDGLFNILLALYGITKKFILSMFDQLKNKLEEIKP